MKPSWILPLLLAAAVIPLASSADPASDVVVRRGIGIERSDDPSALLDEVEPAAVEHVAQLVCVAPGELEVLDASASTAPGLSYELRHAEEGWRYWLEIDPLGTVLDAETVAALIRVLEGRRSGASDPDTTRELARLASASRVPVVLWADGDPHLPPVGEASTTETGSAPERRLYLRFEVPLRHFLELLPSEDC